MQRCISSFRPDIWRPITLEHIDVEHGQPLTFHSKGDLQHYCKEHHVQSGALL
jgi:hypothetical protein